MSKYLAALGVAALLAASPVYAQHYVVGPPNISTSQVSVASTATLIETNRARASVTIENTTTTAVYVGNSTVTTSTGMLLPGVVGAAITIPFSGPIYGIVASGSVTVAVMDLY